MEVKAPDIRKVPLDAVVPYWRNPRQITDEVIEAVAESVQKYGYVAPIIVDADMTVIAGHVRLAALRRLGFTEVEVVVSDMSSRQAQEYRILDNRLAENTIWDTPRLMDEITGLGLEVHFPWLASNYVPEPVNLQQEPTTKEVEVVCPKCYGTWTETFAR